MRSGFSIRSKLLLVALLLLLIPWMSYIYVRDMKAFLLSGQEDALSLAARAVATVLHDRPEFFDDSTVTDGTPPQENEIYAFPLPNYININGDLSDWGEQAKQAINYSAEPVDLALYPNNTINVNHVLGYRGNYIYALFEVEDDAVLFRRKEFLRVDAADHIRLTLQDPGRLETRYTLTAQKPGRMSIYLMDENWQYPITGEPNYDLAAEIDISDQGYNVELRIPRFMLSSDTRIKMVVADVDDTEVFSIQALIPTTPQNESDQLSRLQVQSPEIAKILKGLDRADTRIWVIDKDKQVRAVVGNILTEDNLKPVIRPKSGTDQRNDQIIERALLGAISSDRRPSLDNQGTILMSAHPVYLGDNIPGAVVVEQSTNQVTRRQQETLENVISVTLLVLITVATALLVFASRLTLRIRRLRNATDGAIDRDGRIVTQKLLAEAASGDEIGDLSRSVSNMLGRLSQYTSYLRGLPDTLAHEVSNPLNVVNSSLHNLQQEMPGSVNSKYMQRAQNGIARIGAILRNLTEAANLEQAMQSETRETVDLVKMIESYVDGYSISNPEQAFAIDIETQRLMVEIAPDYIAQALDKLVDNAIDFAAPGTAITIGVKRSDKSAQIDVVNLGSRLPEGMAERIFEPLVSLGRKDAQKTRLGMGLYVVKLIASFHGGDVHAQNQVGTDGVVFSLSLPLNNPEALDD